ncbi:cell wall-active antibiotics response protein LiaF [Virgibacillus alimentarius]|uniref:Lia operon protein LiaF n=1 Tax=Virgibacillus alimentarius TaxID=698769 RepID=A0ABS4S8S1_9BACI|nr:MULTISPECIES: cell wall-active antibiotics response protein LiaF [Virgibacillus]MBP2257903.1 lia operon protein LiaF [Virgibacillus alimentarius]HLR69482.1 cell wall-active antibiotics response protein LiaF [Virgibacillus sp.]
MFKRLTTDTLNWIIIIGMILFVIEVSFFHGGFIFSTLFSGALVYIGWKKFTQLWGKICFWIGTITLIFSVLNIIAIRFLIVVGLIILIIHYAKSKNEPERIEPIIELDETKENIREIKITPVLDAGLFGDKETSEKAFAWRDINIHGFFGDRVIDLSSTVLPDDTSVISIRHMIGNIVIYVPYEVEICIHHSSIFGRVTILGNYHGKLMNQTISYQTENYVHTDRRVKIMTSLLSGDIEVKRI